MTLLQADATRGTGTRNTATNLSILVPEAGTVPQTEPEGIDDHKDLAAHWCAPLDRSSGVFGPYNCQDR